MFTDVNIIAVTATLERHFHNPLLILSPHLHSRWALSSSASLLSLHTICTLQGAGIISGSTEWRDHNQTTLLGSYGTRA